MLKELIDKMDESPIQSMQFWTTPTSTTNKTNVPPANIKEVFIRDCIHKVQHIYLADNNCEYVDSTLSGISEKLNELYSRSQHFCWRSHEHHFHPGFFEYVNCPITCLAEISEFLSKLTKELYNA